MKTANKIADEAVDIANLVASQFPDTHTEKLARLVAELARIVALHNKGLTVIE